MTEHRPVRIVLNLPGLSPQQARSLSCFLEELAEQLWDAYGPEIITALRALEIQDQDDFSSDEYEAYLERCFKTTKTPEDPDYDADF